jgi:hypothetical protein
MSPALVVSGLACLAGVAACAAPEAVTASAAETRLLVKLVDPSTDATAIARQAALASGLPVRYLSATSPQWHALALRCGSDAACDAAIGRLRADAARFAAVPRDERKRAAAP